MRSITGDAAGWKSICQGCGSGQRAAADRTASRPKPGREVPIFCETSGDLENGWRATPDAPLILHRFVGAI